MFSGRENCCRIPPADSTVEAWEYCEQSGGAVYEYEEEKRKRQRISLNSSEDMTHEHSMILSPDTLNRFKSCNFLKGIK